MSREWHHDQGGSSHRNPGLGKRQGGPPTHMQTRDAGQFAWVRPG